MSRYMRIYKEDYWIGWKRYINEIFKWYDYTDEQVAAINEELKTKKVEGYFLD